MNGKCFVDTNILVYAHDSVAGRKHDQARALIEQLWESGQGVLSTQVLQEFCINVRRKAGHPLSNVETRRTVQDYLSWEVVVNVPESVIRALDIEERYKLSFWDALIVGSAELCGASVLYTEDLAHGQVYASVRAVNPFVGG
ncbi:MAG TPA: PIN domain-containing protein [Candidatus Acidoferrum sp.]|nr:PIN domain-containing protein [Candidatus Acidoferrum sp.]